MDELILSVAEINSYVSDKLSTDPFLEEIWVKGEVTDVNAKYETMYFVLKDEVASVNCMLFNCAEALEKAEAVVEGQTILVRGDISLYHKSGSYRIIVKEVQSVGLGELYARFVRIREKLDKSGVFDEAHKRPIPKYPKKIGIVTSEKGAVVEDIRNVAQRRNPYVKLVLYPVHVQGEDATSQIVRGIEYFNANTDVDVLIVGRGGGSAEDLFAFNEEAVVLSVYNSRIPVISAVGHETDYTLCDMAADMRAPTPSAAAELAITAKDEIYASILAQKEIISSRLSQLLHTKKMMSEQYMRHFQKDLLALRIDNARAVMLSCRNTISSNTLHLYKKCTMQYNNYKSAIENLSPMSAFERGYSIAMCNGHEVRSINDVSANDEIDIVLADGTINTRVIRSKKNA